MNKNLNIPRTPFSTRLSGSARETELRIRNIISGPKRRPPIPFLILVFSLCVFCGNIVSCQQQPAQPTIVMKPSITTATPTIWRFPCCPSPPERKMRRWRPSTPG